MLYVREANDAAAELEIERNRQRKRNCAEWCRRALVAFDKGDTQLAVNLLRQAALEVLNPIHNPQQSTI